MPDIDSAAQLLNSNSQRLISFHLVTEGRALVSTEQTDFWVEAGEIALLSAVGEHTVSDGTTSTYLDSSGALEKFLTGLPTSMRIGGSGKRTGVVCGFISCDPSADGLFLDGLPPALKIGLRDDANDQWMEATFNHLISEAESTRPGASILLSKMAESLLVEALRRFVQQLPDGSKGWLAGIADPVVGSAVTRLHAAPQHPWTVDELARETGSSRSVLTKRFRALLGKSPQSYLRTWRLHLARKRLRTRRESVLRIALEVGYESEAAFNRAFKAEFGLPPGQYRKQIRSESTPNARTE